MQPMRLCNCSCTQFEGTFENPPGRQIKKMQPMRICVCLCRQFEETYENSHRRKILVMQPRQQFGWLDDLGFSSWILKWGGDVFFINLQRELFIKIKFILMSRSFKHDNGGNLFIWQWTSIDTLASQNPELIFLLGEQKTGMTGAQEIFSEALL